MIVQLRNQVESLKIKLKELDIEKKKVFDKLESIIAERDILSI